MSTLKGSLTQPKLGNTGVSSLIKSASTIANETATYNDKLQQEQYAANPTNDNLQKYVKYLNSRISTLQSTGSITDATKALTMSTSDMKSAVTLNNSFNLNQITQQVIWGNATAETKYNYLVGAAKQAQQLGNYDLAATYGSQAASAYQTWQLQLQSSAEAHTAISNANSSASASGDTNAIAVLKGDINEILQAQKDGQDITGALKATTDKINKVLVSQHEAPMPKGTGVNIQSLVSGYFAAAYRYNMDAYYALKDTDPAKAAQYAQIDPTTGKVVGGAAGEIITGAATSNGQFDIGGVKLTAKSAAEAISQPNSLGFNESTGQYSKNQASQYSFNKQGMLVGNYDQNTLGQLQQHTATNSKGIVKQLTAAGFGNIKVGSDGTVTAKLTSKTDSWMQYGKQKGNVDTSSNRNGQVSGQTVTLMPNGKDSFQIVTGDNTRAYSVTFDSNGKAGLYKLGSNNQYKNVAGQHGFNQSVNMLISNGQAQKLQANDAALAASRIKVNNSLNPAAAKMGGSFNLGSITTGKGMGAAPKMVQRAGGGFNFTDANGQAISAARYSQLTGTGFRTLLGQMAAQGDTGAKTALQFVGGDYKFDPTKMVSYQNAGVYNALTWGAGVPKDTGAAPASALKGMANANYKF